MDGLPVAIPPLTTVQCPACHQPVVLGWYGEMVPHHWIQVAVGRVSCPGEGTPVVDGVPVPAGEVGRRG